MSDKNKKGKKEKTAIRTFAQDLEKYKKQAEATKAGKDRVDKNQPKDNYQKNKGSKLSDHSLRHHVSEKEISSTATKPNNKVVMVDSKTAASSGITLQGRHEKQKSEIGEEKIIKQDYQAKIIRETKEHKPKTSFLTDIKDWWSNLTSKKTDQKHTYNVPKSVHRKGVIEKATSKTGTVFTSNTEALRDKIKKRQTETKKESATAIVNDTQKAIPAEDNSVSPTENKKEKKTSPLPLPLTKIPKPITVNDETDSETTKTITTDNEGVVKKDSTFNKQPAAKPEAEKISKTSTQKEVADPPPAIPNTKETAAADIKPEVETKTIESKWSTVSDTTGDSDADDVTNSRWRWVKTQHSTSQEPDRSPSTTSISSNSVKTKKEENVDGSTKQKIKPINKESTPNPDDRAKSKDITVVSDNDKPVNEIIVHKEKFIDRININAVAITVLFISLCLFLVYFGYQNLPQLIERYNEATADRPAKSKAQKLFSQSDELKSIVLTSADIDKLPALILDSIQATGTPKNAEITIIAPDGNEISTAYLFNLLNFNTKPSLRGAIKLFRFLSIKNSDPILILKFNDRQTVHGGLLDWENDMLRNLSVLYDNYEIEDYNNIFNDKEVVGINTRLVTNESGETILLYGFIDDETVVIANNENLFMEAITFLRQK